MFQNAKSSTLYRDFGVCRCFSVAMGLPGMPCAKCAWTIRSTTLVYVGVFTNMHNKTHLFRWLQ